VPGITVADRSITMKTLTSECLEQVVGGDSAAAAAYSAAYPACLEVANKIVGQGGSLDYRIAKVTDLCPSPATR
jgi:hypothetical protein